MFRVLDDAAARNASKTVTLSRVLDLAKDLEQSGEPFNAETYEHILSAYSKLGEDKILILHEQMESQGIKPTRTFYHKALQVNSKRKGGRGARKVKGINSCYSWQLESVMLQHKRGY